MFITVDRNARLLMGLLMGLLMEHLIRLLMGLLMRPSMRLLPLPRSEVGWTEDVSGRDGAGRGQQPHVVLGGEQPRVLRGPVLGPGRGLVHRSLHVLEHGHVVRGVEVAEVVEDLRQVGAVPEEVATPGPGPGVELETKVHTKVRNDGEGPYLGLVESA